MALPWIVPEWRESEISQRQICFITLGIFLIEIPSIIFFVWGGLLFYCAVDNYSYSAVNPYNDGYKNNKRLEIAFAYRF